MVEHGAQYLEGLLVGIQQNQTRTEVWLQNFENRHKVDLTEIREEMKAEIEALNVRMSQIEERITHDRATRAAWNQLIGALVAIATIATTFFSGAFNHMFGK